MPNIEMLAELFFPETLLLGLKMVTVSLGPYAAFPLCEHPCVFSSYQESEKVKVKLLSRVRLFATLWAVAYQAPPSMEFSRQEYWSGLPFPSPGDLPDPGIEPRSPALQADALPSEPPGKFGTLSSSFLFLWKYIKIF